MSRGKQVFLTLALALAAAWPAMAVTTSGSVAATDDRAPEPVSNVTAFPGAVGVELSWDLSPSDFVRQSPAGLDFTSGGIFVNVNDVAKYNVWRNENGGAFALAGSTMAGVTTFVDESAVSGSTFIYEVRAADGAGNESGTNEQTAPISLGPPPTAVITPAASVDFGDVEADGSASETFVVANTATDPLALLSATILVQGTGFSSATTSLTVGADNSTTFEVLFEAAEVGNLNGEYEGTLTIRTNDPNNRSIVIALAASISAGISGPDIGVAPAVLAFSRTRLLNTTGSSDLVVSNDGGLQLTGTIELIGSSVFAHDAGSTLDLAAGESLTIAVTFTPTSVGSYEGSLVFATNDADEPTVTVPLTGGGVSELPSQGTVTTRVVQASITFDTTVDLDNDQDVADFIAEFIAQLAEMLGISPDRIKNVTLRQGSVIADFEIAKTGGAESEPTAEEAVADLVTILSDTTTTNLLTENIAPVTAVVDNTEDVVLQPVDADGEPILGWFSRGGTSVDFDDFFLFADNFGLTSASSQWDPIFDIAPEGAADGQINFDDFFRFADDFGKIVANAAEIQDALE